MSRKLSEQLLNENFIWHHGPHKAQRIANNYGVKTELLCDKVINPMSKLSLIHPNPATIWIPQTCHFAF